MSRDRTAVAVRLQASNANMQCSCSGVDGRSRAPGLVLVSGQEACRDSVCTPYQRDLLHSSDHSRIFSRRVHLHHQDGGAVSQRQTRIRSHFVATRRSLLVLVVQSKGLITPFYKRCFSNHCVPFGNAAGHMSHADPNGSSDSLIAIRYHGPIGDPYPSPTQSVGERKIRTGYCPANGSQS